MSNQPPPGRRRSGRWRRAAIPAALAALAACALVTAPPAIAAAGGGTPGGAAGRSASGAPGPVQVWTTTTSSAGTLALQLAREPDITFGPPSSQPERITVSPDVSYQRIQGFGGAMTDTAAYLIDHSPERSQIMTDLFGSGGAHFDFIRFPMGASDLSLSNYSYDTMPPGETDPTLAHFSVAHDKAYIIPVFRQALSLDRGIKIDATPWSAPAWMKYGDTFTGDCTGLENYLNPKYYGAYAEYFAKFVTAYARYGIPVYMVGMQNEPQNCSAGYATMNLDATGPNPSEAAFAPYLRAALDASGHAGVQILGYDHNWYGPDGEPTTYPQQLMAAAGADVDAIGYHCYSTPSGVSNPYDVQTTFHDAYPDTPVYFTECSGGSWAPDAAGNLDWEALNNIIGPMRNWAVASDYWTMATDPAAGPNVANSKGGCGDCRGMVTIDNSNGTFTLNEDYFIWGQFAKFVQPGAVRIGSPDLESSDLPNIAFRNPDGSLVLVVLNDNATSPQSFGVDYDGRGFSYTLPASSIATFTWSPSRRPASGHADAAPLGASCGAAVSGIPLNRSRWTASTNTPVAAGGTAAMAIDGSLATAFTSSAPQADGMYWETDMGSFQTFDELQMQAPDAPGDDAVSYAVEVSGNGRSWRTVATCEGTGDPETVSFPPQTARYVKVVDTVLYDGLSTSTASPWSIAELNLYRGGMAR
jgi:glucosylceramidase